MSAEKLERPLFINMDFDEALRRFAQTKPEEVQPPPGQKKKGARPEPKPKASAPVKKDD
ncbi:hypothetical protein NI456_03525 [Brevundimonas diminuta]|uniref:hypothetical protein n=1 Tax=Brevundimonas diminuta TaxID=293 RepID=UPI0020977AD7|nr:hypothetical protein [Brevundimonas diminuta]MCO8017923.1 hypothetical protein [Brevundimonas diminuta]MCO8021443.1 hypothetical protein [Brevundimonas diminuta]